MTWKYVMPRRYVREGINGSRRMEDMVRAAGWACDSFYRRMLNVVDDYGCFEYRLNLLKLECYKTLHDLVRDADVKRWITECVKAGLVRVYAAHGRFYIEILDFRQAPRSERKFPDPKDCQVLTITEVKQLEPDKAEDVKRICATDEAHLRPRTSAHSSARTSTRTSGDTGPPPRDIFMETLNGKPAIPAALDSPEFRQVWEEFLSFRVGKDDPLSPISQRHQLHEFIGWGPERSIAAIKHTLAKGWKGIREADSPNGNRKAKPKGAGIAVREDN